MQLDVFLPTIPFYEAARMRRRRLILANQPVMVWDAESLAVFKMMFFRRKDLADVEQILRTQGAQFDRQWVREHLAEMYGARDPGSRSGTTWCANTGGLTIGALFHAARPLGPEQHFGGLLRARAAPSPRISRTRSGWDSNSRRRSRASAK